PDVPRDLQARRVPRPPGGEDRHADELLSLRPAGLPLPEVGDPPDVPAHGARRRHLAPRDPHAARLTRDEERVALPAVPPPEFPREVDVVPHPDLRGEARVAVRADEVPPEPLPLREAEQDLDPLARDLPLRPLPPPLAHR